MTRVLPLLATSVVFPASAGQARAGKKTPRL